MFSSFWLNLPPKKILNDIKRMYVSVTRCFFFLFNNKFTVSKFLRFPLITCKCSMLLVVEYLLNCWWHARCLRCFKNLRYSNLKPLGSCWQLPRMRSDGVGAIACRTVWICVVVRREFIWWNWISPKWKLPIITGLKF